MFVCACGAIFHSFRCGATFHARARAAGRASGVEGVARGETRGLGGALAGGARRAGLKEVDEAPGRGDAHLNARAERALLLLLGHAAVHARGFHAAAGAELGALELDLHRELPRRGEDERDGPVAGREDGLGVDVDDPREDVGKSLPGARLGDADQVAPEERHGPPLRLDGRRRREAGFAELLKDVVREARLRGGREGEERDAVITTEGSGRRGRGWRAQEGRGTRRRPAVGRWRASSNDVQGLGTPGPSIVTWFFCDSASGVSGLPEIRDAASWGTEDWAAQKK